jgi:hypothetical protein
MWQLGHVGREAHAPSYGRRVCLLCLRPIVSRTYEASPLRIVILMGLRP